MKLQSKEGGAAFLDVAAVQLTSGVDCERNLARVRDRVAEAASRGARFVALPENFALMAGEAEKRTIAESLDGGGPIVSTLRALARDHQIFLLGGGFPERSADPSRPYNTSVLVGPGGDVVASYRKMHLFDVSLPTGECHAESATTSAGASDPVVGWIDGVSAGLTICYDVRFPELFRRFVDLQARLVTVPAAFTVPTGEAHWHVLLRARAIENQLFLVAPAQWGSHENGRKTFGRSLVIDPWGGILAECGDGESIAIARLDFSAQDRIRAAMPVAGHRRLA